MAVLITGVGYIGSQLALDLLERQVDVVGLENFFCTPRSAHRPLRRHPRFTLVEGSINSRATLERLFSRYPIDVVYHLAAQPSGHPEAAPLSYTETTNLVGLRLVLDAAVRYGVRRFVYGGSFWVYGGDLKGTVTEGYPWGRSPDFAHASKFYAEKLLEVYTARYGIECATMRLGIVYGLGPVMKTDPRFMTVPNRFCLLAARGQPLTVHPGSSRPLGFIHLKDAARGLALLGQSSWPGHGPERSSPYLAANGATEAISVAEVAALVIEVGRQRGLDVRLAADPEPGERAMWQPSSILEGMGFRPRYRMADSLGEVLDYFMGRQGPSAAPPVRGRQRGEGSTCFPGSTRSPEGHFP